MSESMKVLEEMPGILQDMQNIERQIENRDSRVRNRPFTAEELMEERALETEKGEKRKQLDTLKSTLARLLEDKQEAESLKTELLEKIKNASTSEEISKCGLYNEWIKEATAINSKKAQLDRIRSAGSQTSKAVNLNDSGLSQGRDDHDER